MRASNAFQITAMFAAGPFVIGWLRSSQPLGDVSHVATFVAACVYIVGFCFVTTAVYGGIKDN